ncbi:helix-turn-helix transcriptional regulator [Dactylosporangium sp. NPDC051541]|uniref:helix-turn-helix transcriptional regulator n=1 Tax=Dactylosporangium sp. NPDC051541 TaxID=3363977 RepID=UPI0037B5E15A
MSIDTLTSSAPSGSQRRKELAAFVRSRRERRRPDQAGLVVAGRRRTPGLRREEVAMLAGVSVTWYTWLEQARDIRVSRPVLAGLGRALGLDDVERTHLYRLAGEVPPGAPAAGELPAQYRLLLDQLDPSPALLANHRFDILAWNRAATLFYGDLTRFPRHRRNVLWLMFTEPDIQAISDDFAHESAYTVALFRAHTAEGVLDPGVAALIDELSAASPPFAALWRRGDLAPFVPQIRALRHPRLGRVELEYVKMRAVGTDATLVAYLAAPGSTTAARLAGLVADQPV